MQKRLTDIEALKLLKQKLLLKQMSVLVGAGFSKNVSKSFPLWDELLFDMAYSLHKKEIEDAFAAVPKSRKVKKQQFVKEKVSDIIERFGYLELVSEYIRRKGYVEAVTTYIEERTPKVHEQGDESFLIKTTNDGESREIFHRASLDLHRALLDLSWNNIYTTNYDDMIERANDASIEADIRTAQKNVDEEIKDLVEKRSKSENIKKKLEDEISTMDQQLADINSSSIKSNMPITSGKILFDEETYKKKGEALFRVSIDINSLHRQLKNLEKELLAINTVLEDCIRPILESSALSVKRNKNIIKLHGSLRNDSDEFGFDNDTHNHYIISKEDYESYPQKHEAFTQLMRISLLQESYCLIGFSGVDPNFLEWIKWVRDILKRAPGEKHIPKIYLINVGNETIDSDKQLFYDNFRIHRISLQSNEVIKFLINETDTVLSDPTDKKELLAMFMQYLKEDSFSTPKAFIARLQSRAYLACWQQISIQVPLDKIDLDKVVSLYEPIMANRGGSIIKPLSYLHHRNKFDLIYHAVDLLERLDSKPEKQIKLLKMIIVALEDMMLPVRSQLKESEERYILELASKIDKEDALSLKKLKLRDALLSNDMIEYELLMSESFLDRDDFKYYQLLDHAFHLEFSNLKKAITDWDPESPMGILRKASFLMVFDPVHVDKFLNKYRNLFDDTLIQQRIYFLEILRHAKFSNNLTTSSQINEIILKLEGLGFETTAKMFDQIIDDVRPNDEKLDRYGAGRFNVNSGFGFSRGFTKYNQGAQFLNLLILLGTQMRSGNVNFKSVKNWYWIYKLTFERYTSATIYYTLGFSEGKMIRRMAQDCAYSNNLSVPLDTLVDNLLGAFLQQDTPRNYKESALLFATELLIAIPVVKWQERFFEVWQSDKFTDSILNARRDEELIFVSEAIIYLSDIEMIRAILTFCLDNASNSNVIMILYHFNSNKVYKSGKGLLTDDLRLKIDAVIANLPYNESLWFTLGNLAHLLNERQKESIKNKIISIISEGVKEERIWRIILFFAKGDGKCGTKIKEGVLRSQDLFHAGFSKNMKSLSMGEGHIEIHRLSRGRKSFWSKTQAVEIYKRMSEEFSKIKKWNLKSPDSTFETILREMVLFLNHEHDKLNNFDGYGALSREIKETYIIHRGFVTYVEALSSDDGFVVNWALFEMSFDIELKNVNDDLRMALQILISRLILEKEASFESGINYLSSWISDKRNDELFVPYFNMLQILLEKFSGASFEGYNIPFVMKHFISIARSLKRCGLTGKGVDLWIARGRKNRFQN